MLRRRDPKRWQEGVAEEVREYKASLIDYRKRLVMAQKLAKDEGKRADQAVEMLEEVEGLLALEKNRVEEERGRAEEEKKRGDMLELELRKRDERERDLSRQLEEYKEMAKRAGMQ